MSGASRKQPGKAPAKKTKGVPVAFTVWQFVRVMVELESKGMKSAAYRAWWKDWTKLDRRLARLAKADTAGYSALMMDEEVVIADATPAEIADVVKALDAVVRQLNTALQTGGDDADRTSLEFERAELIELRDELKRHAPGPARGSRVRKKTR